MVSSAPKVSIDIVLCETRDGPWYIKGGSLPRGRKFTALQPIRDLITRLIMALVKSRHFVCSLRYVIVPLHIVQVKHQVNCQVFFMTFGTPLEFHKEAMTSNGLLNPLRPFGVTFFKCN